MGETRTRRPGLAREALVAAALLVLGVGARLLFAWRFPAVAFSDFRALIDFGQELGSRGPTAECWHWVQFNPGLPMVLSLLPGSPEAAARIATVVSTGFLPLLPFFLWRPILPLRWRTLAGVLLALWPGQLFFSGVVAQENWALLPAVALGSLAVRALRLPGSHPVSAGLLLACATAVRQELLVVLAPAALAAAGLGRSEGSRLSRGARLALAAGVPLLALALQRQAATGRFAITTEHGGLALLGSVIPGAAGPGWADPKAYIASVDPALLEDRDAARRASSGMALAEWKRRPAFHALRSVAAAARLSVESDADDLYWSVGAPEAQPETSRARGAAFYARWFPRLRWELALIQGLFVAAVLQGLRRRDAAILVLAACVLLKYGLQSVASPLGRLMVPATALELLVIALGAASIGRGAWQRPAFLAAAVAVGLLLVEPKLNALVISKDEPPRAVARFPLEIGGEKAFARCAVEAGVVTSIEWKRAWMRPDPAGTPARVRCELPAISLRLRLDEASGGGRDMLLAESDRGPDGTVLVELAKPGGFGFRRDMR